MKFHAAAAALCVVAAAFAASAESVLIQRDEWGVPHIYADTPDAGMYGLGYAMAEDRLDDLYRNVHTAIGTMAEHFGPDYVLQDYVMRVVDNRGRCREYWETAPEELRILGERLVEGVRAFEAAHPERVPEYAVPLEGWMTISLARAMILNWPLGTIRSKMGRSPAPPAGASNAWAVMPQRTAGGRAILLTDVHLTWESLALFYEARVQAGDLHMNGWFITGSPLVGLGHNGHVGWALTTGGPDTAQVYQLQIDPEQPFRYQVDGEWRQAEIKLQHIRVKGEGPRVMPSMFTLFGPVLGEPDLEAGTALAGLTPYLDDMGLFEQFYGMIMARDSEQFFEAIKMNHLMPQNVLWADRAGNIGYLRTGRTPIRPEGDWDWSRPVPGDTAATLWTEIYPIEEHVQLLNPPQGYMQNCNISPAVMLEDSPLTPDRYPPALYNVSWDQNNPRGKRALQLLAANDKITDQDAKDITMDVYDILAKPWQEALRAAAEAHDPGCPGAVGQVLDWHGEFTQESAAATLVWQWRLHARDALDTQAVADGASLDAEAQQALLEALCKAQEAVEALYGSGEVPWGQTRLVGRGGHEYPFDGADFGSGPIKTETLRDVESREIPDRPGHYLANSGSIAPMLMFLGEDGIESYTLHPWGQSNDPESPHYMDQGRELYSKRKFKRAWFSPEEVAPHVQSEKRLTLP